MTQDRIDPAHFWPPRDRDGAKVLHRFELPLMLRATPWVLKHFTGRVPAEFMAESVEDGVPVIVVSCPCGEEPTLRWRTRAYSMEECGCGRFFIHDGKNVRVAGGPERAAAPHS